MGRGMAAASGRPDRLPCIAECGAEAGHVLLRSNGDPEAVLRVARGDAHGVGDPREPFP